MVLGLGVTAWSGFHFIRARGTPVPFNPPPELVTSGPYRLSGNPMLTEVFLLLVGLGVAVSSVSLVLFFVPWFLLINVWELKAIERYTTSGRSGSVCKS